MKLKKMIAMVMVAVMLFVGTIAAASAGVIGDFFASAGKTLAHGFKTIGNAVIGTAELAFTDKKASECYEDMFNSMDKVAENACDIAKNTVQAGKDIADMAVGSAKVLYGGVCAAGTALYATEEWIRTGEKDYSTARSFVDTIKEGYKQADNGVFMDLAMIAGTAVGVPTYALIAANALKTGVEYAVDYKTGEEAVQTLISSSVSAVTMGAGAAAGAVGGSAAGAITGAVVGTGVKIGTDIVTDKDDRSALDIVLEDVCTAGVNAAVSYGARKAGNAIRGVTPANVNNDTMDETSEMESIGRNSYQDDVSNFTDETSAIAGPNGSNVVKTNYDGLVKIYGYENDSLLDPLNNSFYNHPTFNLEVSDIDLNNSNTSFADDLVIGF